MSSNESEPDVDALLARARRLYHGHGPKRFLKAIASYERVLECDPRYEAAWSELATMHWEAGHAPEAIACSERAIELAPDSPVRWDRLLGYLSELNDRQSEQDRDYHRRNESMGGFDSLGALRERMLECAAQLLSVADGDRWFTEKALQARAKVLHDLGRFDEALEPLHQLRDMNAFMFDDVQLAFGYEAAGRYDQALRYIDKGLESGADDVAMRHKARILGLLGRPDDRIATLEELVRRLDPKTQPGGDAAYFFQKSTVLKELGLVAEARECLERLLAEDREYPEPGDILERIRELEAR